MGLGLRVEIVLRFIHGIDLILTEQLTLDAVPIVKLVLQAYCRAPIHITVFFGIGSIQFGIIEIGFQGRRIQISTGRVVGETKIQQIFSPVEFPTGIKIHQGIVVIAQPD